MIRPRPISLFRWSNPSIKGLLSEFMHGIVGELSIPAGTGKDYLNMLSDRTSDRRVGEVDARGRVRYRWHQVRNGEPLQGL